MSKWHTKLTLITLLTCPAFNSHYKECIIINDYMNSVYMVGETTPFKSGFALLYWLCHHLYREANRCCLAQLTYSFVYYTYILKFTHSPLDQQFPALQFNIYTPQHIPHVIMTRLTPSSNINSPHLAIASHQWIIHWQFWQYTLHISKL